MIQREDKLSFRLRPGLLDALDEMRRLEKDIPTRSEMLNRLIERAANPAKLKGDPMPRHTTSEPRQQPRAPDEKAVRAVRRGVASALEKRTGNTCQDCGANINLVGAKHNCKGKQK